MWVLEYWAANRQLLQSLRPQFEAVNIHGRVYKNNVQIVCIDSNKYMHTYILNSLSVVNLMLLFLSMFDNILVIIYLATA